MELKNEIPLTDRSTLTYSFTRQNFPFEQQYFCIHIIRGITSRVFYTYHLSLGNTRFVYTPSFLVGSVLLMFRGSYLQFSVLCFLVGSVAHIFSFLCCVFWWVLWLISLVFCVVFFGGFHGSYLLFSVLCFLVGSVAHIFSFLCCVFGGFHGSYLLFSVLCFLVGSVAHIFVPCCVFWWIPCCYLQFYVLFYYVSLQNTISLRQTNKDEYL